MKREPVAQALFNAHAVREVQHDLALLLTIALTSHLLGLQSQVGTLEPGKLADVAALSDGKMRRSATSITLILTIRRLFTPL